MEYEFNEVSLLITHYNRPLSLERLLYNFKKLDCSFAEIIVSDDCSKKEHLEKLTKLKTEYDFKLITSSSNKGLGNNLNKGQDAVSVNYTLYVQEDFVPLKPFPEKLSIALSVLEEEKFDFIRFYGNHKYPYLKPFKDEFSEMRFSLWKPGNKKFQLYSDNSHLRKSNFFEKFGRYKEGIHSDRTEERMMVSVLRKKGKALFFENNKELLKLSNDLENSTLRSVGHLGKGPIKFIRSLIRTIR